MTDTELRIEVAELLGWTDVVILERGILRGDHPDTDRGRECVPNYPADLNAAWGLLEDFTIDCENGQTFVQVYPAPNADPIVQLSVPGTGTDAKAAARAICEAFVKVKQGQTEKGKA